MHDDEVHVDSDVVRRLIVEQFPQWAHLPVRRVRTAATVNAIFRVGNELAVRLPLRNADPVEVRQLLQQEVRAAEEFHALSPFPAPRPVAVGEPGHGYPMPWSVQTWVPGRDAVTEDPAGSASFAQDLVALIVELRSADVRGRRFAGHGRGGHLPDHDEWVALCMERSRGLLDVVRLRALWAELRALPEVDDDVMCHGDLTPPNVLVREGRLAGVLDTGGFAAADPALDLVAVWHLIDAEQRDLVRRQLDCSEVQWRRGMAWALQQALGLVWYYGVSNPPMARWGKRTLERLLASATE